MAPCTGFCAIAIVMWAATSAACLGCDPPATDREGHAGEAAPAAPLEEGVRLVMLHVALYGEVGERAMLGLEFNADALRDLLPDLERSGAEVVVLRLNVDDGGLEDARLLAALIGDELDSRFRVVAWIDSAFGTAALLAGSVDEIVFLPSGRFAPGNPFQGFITPARGRDPWMEYRGAIDQMSELAGRDPAVMREIAGYMAPDSAFEPESIRPVNAVRAERVGLSRGTAGDVESLMEVLGVGPAVDVGVEIDLKLRDAMMESRRQAGAFHEAMRLHSEAEQVLRCGDAKARKAAASRARDALGTIESLARANPRLAPYIGGASNDLFVEFIAERRRWLEGVE